MEPQMQATHTSPTAAPFTRMAAMDDEERERAAHVEQLKAEYAKAVAGDVSLPAYFAPRSWASHGVPAVHQVIADSLDRADFMQRAMAILAAAAAGRGTQRDAQVLLAEAGASWADAEVDFL
jgi:ribulose-5-phosphate 4-epimerase/fuculose-1-phosphate aldolase